MQRTSGKRMDGAGYGTFDLRAALCLKFYSYEAALIMAGVVIERA